MSINKVIVNEEVKLDLSADTAEASNVEKGYTFHDANGDLITGELEKIETMEQAMDKLGSKDTAYYYGTSGDQKIFYFNNSGLLFKPTKSDDFFSANDWYHLDGLSRTDAQVNNTIYKTSDALTRLLINLKTDYINQHYYRDDNDSASYYTFSYTSNLDNYPSLIESCKRGIFRRPLVNFSTSYGSKYIYPALDFDTPLELLQGMQQLPGIYYSRYPNSTQGDNTISNPTSTSHFEWKNWNYGDSITDDRLLPLATYPQNGPTSILVYSFPFNGNSSIDGKSGPPQWTKIESQSLTPYQTHPQYSYTPINAIILNSFLKNSNEDFDNAFDDLGYVYYIDPISKQWTYSNSSYDNGKAVVKVLNTMFGNSTKNIYYKPEPVVDADSKTSKEQDFIVVKDAEGWAEVMAHMVQHKDIAILDTLTALKTNNPDEFNTLLTTIKGLEDTTEEG